MEQPVRKAKYIVRLLFNCPEKIDGIVEMFKRIGYKNIILSMIIDEGFSRKARIRITLGKNTRIYTISNLRGELKGVAITVNLLRPITVIDCCIENRKNRKDRICLDTLDGVGFRRVFGDRVELAEVMLNWNFKRFLPIPNVNKKICQVVT
jgi:hypothetical protein